MAASDARDQEQLFGGQFVRRTSVVLVLAVVVYAGLLIYADAPRVGEELGRVSGGTFVLSFAISVVSFLLRALRWLSYLRAVKIDIPPSDGLVVFLAGLGMSITPGKVGEVLKSLMLKERYDVPVARSAPILVAERFTDLVALVLLGLVSLLWTYAAVAAVAVFVLGLLAAFGLGRFQSFGLLLIRFVCTLPRVAKHRDKLVSAHASLRKLWDLGPFCVGLSLAFAAWGLQALTVTLFVDALGWGGLPLRIALIAYAAPLLAGTLAFLPGGLGLTEATMAGVLPALSGVSATAGAAVTILTRLSTFWFAIAIGFGALGVWRLRRKSV